MATKSLIALFILLIPFEILYAAACCGGGASLPTLITGDYQGQVVLSASNAAITHDSNSKGAIRARNGNNQEVIEVLTLATSYLLSPYWQVGFTLPYKLNTHKAKNYEESSNGLSDIKAQVGYEFLPEYGFSLWKPKGYIFLEQTFSTSNSTYDADKPLRSDSLGNGFHTTALGLSFTKAIYSFDFLFMSEVHQGFKRSFQQDSETFSVTPKLGGSILLGAGYSHSRGNFRVGGSLLYSREGKRKIEGDILTISNSSYFLETGINASYLYNDLSFSISYKDQSFLAQASNIPLSKSVSASLIKFFEL